MFVFNQLKLSAVTGVTLGLILLLQGCVTAPQTQSLTQQTIQIPAAHEISQVPFFPQEEYFCGPTTLAEILNFYGASFIPEQIAGSLFIPEREGSLQIEMVAAARQHDLLPYAEQGNLLQLLSLVSEDIPVIVFQNLGTSWYPLWHYALVIGYDLDNAAIILHTGVTERRIVAMDLFESTWRKGDYWMLAALPPDKTSSYFEPFVYVSAAQDLSEVGKSDAAIKALISATSQWPDYWLAYFLLGNFYLEMRPGEALSWFQKGLASGADNPRYLNNYAYALLSNNHHEEALTVINEALGLDPLNVRLQDSVADISSRVSDKDSIQAR